MKKNKQGMALFIVMSSLAVLSIVVAELSYSTHMQNRLILNYLDGTKAFYSAKAGYKIALMRLMLYSQMKAMISNDKSGMIGKMVPQNFIDKVWSFPFAYPIPVPPDTLETMKEAYKKFESSSSLEGGFQLDISSEGARLNFNNLLVKTPPKDASTPGSAPTPNPTATAPTEVDFKPLVEGTIDQLLRGRKEIDREFSEIYRDVAGKDIVDAVSNFLKSEKDRFFRPNLPGGEDTLSKNAPLFNMDELHFIKGFDDTLYDLIEPSFTVFNTPGINVNKAGKDTLKALIPELTDEDIAEFLKNRDDPEIGKLFKDDGEFWQSIQKSSIGSKIEHIKERFVKAGLKVVTSEETFRIRVTADVGLATRTIEAYVLLSGKKPNTGSNPANNNQGSPAPTPVPANPQTPGDQTASTNKEKPLELLYWRLI